MRYDQEAQDRVVTMIRRDGFPEVVRRLEVNRGLIYRVWKDGIYSPTVRRALDMEVRKVPVPPCSCGEVHTVPWCTKKKGAPVPETEKEIVYVEVQPEPPPKPKKRSGPKPYRRAAYFGKGDEARGLAERWDEVAQRWDGMTGLARGILDGKYKVTEVE